MLYSDLAFLEVCTLAKLFSMATKTCHNSEGEVTVDCSRILLPVQWWHCDLVDHCGTGSKGLIGGTARVIRFGLISCGCNSRSPRSREGPLDRRLQ